MASTPGMLAAIVGAFMAASGGIWYASPAHQEQLHNKVATLNEKIRRLERNMVSGAADKKHKIAAKIRSLLHRSDQNGDGFIDEYEKSSIEAAIAEQLGEDMDESEGGSSAKVAVIIVGVVVLLAMIAGTVFYFRKRRMTLAQNSRGILKLTVVGCHDLPNVDVKSKDPTDLTDAKVEVTIGTQRKTTEVVKNQLSPKFNSAPFGFHVDLNKPEGKTATLRVVDSMNSILNCGAEQAVGTATLDLTEFALAPNTKVVRHLCLILDYDVPNPEGTHPTVEVVGVYIPRASAKKTA